TDIFFAITCYDKEGYEFKIGTREFDDTAILNGDCIEILIETDSNSYYQIVVNPDGVITDCEYVGEKQNLRWHSKAEVAVVKNKDHWNVEIRIPFTPDNDDPLHLLTGRKPSPDLPWHFNICRRRPVTENVVELTALSPTGKRDFRDPIKFAVFYEGRSQARKKAGKDKDGKEKAEKKKE
ncbi:MAG: DOMON domain-containing protein, partial [Planctomycetota bacterium]